MEDKKVETSIKKKVYDGSPYINIFIDKVELPDGKIIDDYHRIEVNNAVMFLSRIILVNYWFIRNIDTE